MQDDILLIKQLQANDERALSLLYDKYSGALYSVIIKMTGDEGLSQDLLQESFITIWDKSHQYNPEKGRFYTWAYRIAKNKVLNYLRKTDILIQTDDLSVYENNDEPDTINRDFFELNGAITKLEAHHQKAIELVYFKGLTHREAHAEMDVPLGTFKSYIQQALKQLRVNYIKIIVFLLLMIDVM
ncbi:MAG: sigma-70 family RNA polymerase sigma factor [Winogradskyella sp.]|uniref:RNA polymerase sigma factor n=1 Tax=Winogradskyella sp. TaxID=1883156 RepID=UPI00181E125A|nr:sigma-70 family RNA polymerase sigma factor [Winogradskyella sp.]MBT8244164.1 sigma-70 family RNA polymerase sigma factor [Winogradskyella sp.]NNK23449.1 sigma-70 family RNA polymerase sigma factor [Winogradskyella sp.]